MKGIDKNLADLKRLIPTKSRRPKSRGKSAEKKYFASKNRIAKKVLDENNMNNQNQNVGLKINKIENEQGMNENFNRKSPQLEGNKLNSKMVSKPVNNQNKKIEKKLEKVMKKIERNRP